MPKTRKKGRNNKGKRSITLMVKYCVTKYRGQCVVIIFCQQTEMRNNICSRNIGTDLVIEFPTQQDST